MAQRIEKTPDMCLAGLGRYIFSAPSWPRSLAIIVMLSLLIEAAGLRAESIPPFFGLLGVAVPGIGAFLLTRPLSFSAGTYITWNRSALLSLTATVLAVIGTLVPVIISGPSILHLSFAISLGLILAIRILVLSAIASNHFIRIIPAAFIQSGLAISGAAFLLQDTFPPIALLSQVIFGAGVFVIIWLIERPLKRMFQFSVLKFLNTFIAHNTDGSKRMEDLFREIGEAVSVPITTLFFRRQERPDIILTVPNLHPGPMGDIGGGNLPGMVYDAFEEEVLVPHGCATHDLNLVSESEIDKVIQAIRSSQGGLRFSAMASRAVRVRSGSVGLLAQRFGRSILMVGTRAPEVTEDVELSIGMVIMAEGRSRYENVVFIDAHNCIGRGTHPVSISSRTGMEYLSAARKAMEVCGKLPLSEMKIGVSHIRLPFMREEGFGDLGLQTLVVEVDGQRTAYLLFDGNNMAPGMRELLCDTLTGIVDEVEVMTTDTHVVNTTTSMNPVGGAVPPGEIIPFARQAVRVACEDLEWSRAAGATTCCKDVVVFGSQRVAQLAGTVNAMLTYIAPMSLGILLLAFILSVLVYVALG
ncbi:MAG: DUF2070 family protein [Methanoculleaceae archaeon]